MSEVDILVGDQDFWSTADDDVRTLIDRELDIYAKKREEAASDMKNVLKVFISQPMHGRTEEDILEERKRIEELLKEANPCKKSWDICVIDSYIKPELDPEWSDHKKRLWYLGDSIQQMGEADIVVLADHFEDASGCRIEHFTALKYGIDVLYMDIWGDSKEYLSYRLKVFMRERK